jgi:hypothetical protein
VTEATEPGKSCEVNPRVTRIKGSRLGCVGALDFDDIRSSSPRELCSRLNSRNPL